MSARTLAKTSEPMTPGPWMRTPEGIMRQYEPAKSKVPAHWYIDADKHWRVFADADVKPATRVPAKVRRVEQGERLLDERKKARAAKKNGEVHATVEMDSGDSCTVMVRKDRGKGNAPEGGTRFYYTECGRPAPCPKHG